MSASVPNPTLARRPRRRWWRWLATSAVILVGLFAGGVWLDSWLAERDWQAACAEADRLDPGWRWDELIAARPNPPDDQNAALRVRAVAAVLRTGNDVAGALARVEGLEGLSSGRLPRDY